MSNFDLDGYLNRIGYTGPRDVNVETLRGVHRAHLYAVPFENLDVVLKRPIKLDPASLQQKIVTNRRGGYCFESNALLMYGLQALGFTLTPLAARVLWERTEPALPPRSHMLMMVDLEEGLIHYPYAIERGVRFPDEPFPLTGRTLEMIDNPFLLSVPDAEADLRERGIEQIVIQGEPSKSMVFAPLTRGGKGIGPGDAASDVVLEECAIESKRDAEVECRGIGSGIEASRPERHAFTSSACRSPGRAREIDWCPRTRRS